MQNWGTRNCKCYKTHVHNVSEINPKLMFACILPRSLFSFSTAAPRPLIGQQIMHAEWHMFLTLMTLPQQLSGRTERWTEEKTHHLTCNLARNPPPLWSFDLAFCSPNVALTTENYYCLAKVFTSLELFQMLHSNRRFQCISLGFDATDWNTVVKY